jgi:hypothetical protein
MELDVLLCVQSVFNTCISIVFDVRVRILDQPIQDMIIFQLILCSCV